MKNLKNLVLSIILILNFTVCSFVKTPSQDESDGEKEKYNAELKSLVISDAELSPKFKSNSFNYNAICSINLITVYITAESCNIGAEIKLNGEKIISGVQSGPISLTEIQTPVHIEVVSLKGNKKNDYYIDIYKLFEDTINWNKRINIVQELYSIAIDSKNNVYVVGNGPNLIDTSNGNNSLIKKFDSNGVEDTVNWNKKIDNSNADSYFESAYSVAIDSNDNVYVSGTGCNIISSTSGNDWWIRKFNSNGIEDTAHWNKKYSNSDLPEYDAAESIAIDSNDNVYVAGFGTNLINSTSGNDWWIKKFDPNGIEDTVNWNKKINYKSNDAAKSISIDSNNNVYVGGYGNNMIDSSSGYDWWIKKFDSNGVEDTVNWNKIFNNDKYDFIYSTTIDSNDNVYVAGTGYNFIDTVSYDDWWIKKFDPNGVEDTVNWNKKITYNNIESIDRARSIATDSENNVYVAGSGYDLVFINTAHDWWIKKFDSNGVEDTVYWNKKYHSGDYDSANSLAIDENDNIYVAGTGWSYDWWIKKFINP